MDIHTLQGQDISIPSTLKDISSSWRQVSDEAKKARAKSKQRLVMVDGEGTGYGKTLVPVLKSNNYDLLDGERSVFDQELSKATDGATLDRSAAKDVKRKLQIAGRDYDNTEECLHCFLEDVSENNDMLMCDFCPVSVHINCLGKGFEPQEGAINARWSCPQHWCVQCGRSTSQAGNMLFRCVAW